MLTDDHIDYIIKDLSYRGIVLEGFQDEVIDHVCVAVETKMEEGVRFIDAYHDVLKTFGNTSGLRETQDRTLREKNIKATTMLKNYITIGWRTLRRQQFYSFINIIGLAIGVAACMIIVLFIADELQYDRYNTKADRIYRIEADVKFGGNQFQMAYRSAPEAATLMQDYPEIESTVRFRTMGSYLVKPAEGTENIRESSVAWADSTFFKIFSIPVIEGDPKTALKEPASIVISRRIAEKYFPGKSALGQSLIMDNKYNAKITAVYENIPKASHFHFDIIFSLIGDWPIARQALSTSFMSENFLTYILLREGANANALENKLPQFLEKYMGPELSVALGSQFTMEKFKETGNVYTTSLRPLTDIHLHSNVKGDVEPNGNITYVYLFGSIALVILTIACINFMNLSTARSGNRAKEVGVRKVMGSLRSHLIRQFLTESALITIFAFVLAIGLAYLLLPLFNNLAQKQISLPTGNPLFYVVLVITCLLIGLLAGVYPSFFLSAFKPVNVLKGQSSPGIKSSMVRSALVVFQFTISIFLIIGALTINRQMNFIQNTNLGFEKDQVIIVHDGYALRPNNVEPFKNEVLKNSAIESGTISGYIPVENDWSWRSNTTCWKEGNQPTPDNMVGFQQWSIDYDYLKTFRMKIIKGRGFSTQFPADFHSVVLNETAAKRLGFGDDPIGKKIVTFEELGELDPNKTKSLTVVGIVEDFNFSSMKENISALGFVLGVTDGSISFRFKPSETTAVIASIEKVWKSLAPGQPFQYSFLDEDFAQMYSSEQRLGKIFVIFATLAVIIACLGLFALTAFTAEQRTKEIGIRKVLGASVNNIVILMSKDFGKLFLISFLISAPLAWYAVNWWLSTYIYKTDVGIPVYLLAGFLAFVLALGTMSFQSVKAALSNPVKSLRNE